MGGWCLPASPTTPDLTVFAGQARSRCLSTRAHTPAGPLGSRTPVPSYPGNVTSTGRRRQPVIHRLRALRFDPVSSQRVPLAGHHSLVLEAPIRSRPVPHVHDALTARVGGRCQPNWLPRPVRVDRPEEPKQWRVTREQAYVPAEQPSPAQGARFPPAHAHPRRPRHPVRPPSQGPQQPGSLTVATATTGPRVVLPASHRLTEGESFRHTVRSGRRAGARSLVVHLAAPSDLDESQVRVGFVVSRAVGNAVVRNRVRRRLRHLTGEQLDRLPRCSTLVVRALPASASASYAELRADLVRCLQRVVPQTTETVTTRA